MHNREVEAKGCSPPAPYLLLIMLFHRLKYGIVLVEGGKLNEERNVSNFFSVIMFINKIYLSSIFLFIRTIRHFDKFWSSLRHNSAFTDVCKLVCRVNNCWKVILPFLTVLFYFVSEGWSKKWLQKLINISNWQLHQDWQYIKTFGRFYFQLHESYVKSFIRFALRLNLDLLSALIILHKYRGVMNECALNRITRLLPRVLFVVELESYGKDDHFVNIKCDLPLLFQSLKIICATWCINFQGHCPYAYPKLIFSRNIYLVWRVYYQERGVGKTKPWWSACQVKQGAFTCSEVTFNRSLVE